MEQALIFYPEDFKAFLDALKEALRTELKGYGVEEPMTTEQAAAYFRVSPATFRPRIRKVFIPPELVHNAGGTTYFLPSELCAFLKRS